MKKALIAPLLMVNALLYAEPSAFGAGTLSSDNPYGLTESEKIIFENKKELRYQGQKIDQLSEKVEGMRSVVESLSMKVGETGQRINAMSDQSSSASEDQILSLKEDIEALKKEQADNYQKINEVLQKLSTMIDKINSDYVTQDQLNGQSVKKKVTKETPTASKASYKNLSNADMLKEAVGLYRKKYYTKATPMFIELAEKSYKPATSNYYLGEISYYQKQYSDAIVYYKKSVGHYDKASYMPTLLLHTGISFGHLDDTENKKRFLQALIDSYPTSQEAKIAQNQLN